MSGSGQGGTATTAGSAAVAEGGTAITAGGAATNPDEGGGAGGDGDQEPDLVVTPVTDWVRYSGVVNDQLGTVSEQSLALDLRGNGDAVLVWSQSNESSKNDIRASNYHAGVWSTSKIIDGLPGNAAEPHVSMDGQGNAMAIWQQIDDKNRAGIFYARYVAKTGTWTTPASLDLGVAPYNASHPRVAADAAGNVLAAWNLEYGTNNAVTGTRVVSSFYKGAAQTPSWTVPQPLSSPGVPQKCGRPRVALSSAGHGFVTWNDAEGTQPTPRRVYAAKYLITAAGFAATLGLNKIEGPEEPAEIEDVPEVAMDDTGNALVSWRQVGVSGSVGVALSWFAPKTNQWVAQHDICTDRAAIGAPALAIGKSDHFAVSYWASHLGKQQLLVTHGDFDAQGGFGWAQPAAVLETTTAGSDPALAVEQTGTVLLAWTQPLKTADNLLVGRSSATGAHSFGSLQLNLNNGTASPALGVHPGTNLALLTYFEAYDIHSATTSVE